MAGTIRALRNVLSRARIRSSSTLARRLYSTISAIRIAAIFRVPEWRALTPRRIAQDSNDHSRVDGGQFTKESWPQVDGRGHQGVTPRYIHKLFEKRRGDFFRVRSRSPPLRCPPASDQPTSRGSLDRLGHLRLRFRRPLLLQSHVPPTLQRDADRGEVQRRVKVQIAEADGLARRGGSGQVRRGAVLLNASPHLPFPSPLAVDLPRSSRRRGMTALCAFETFERRLESTLSKHRGSRLHRCWVEAVARSEEV